MKSLSRVFIGIAVTILFIIILGHYSNIRGEERIKIRWATYRASPSELQAQEKLIKDYENKNPNVQIVLEPLAWKDQTTYLIAALSSNTQPELMNFFQSGVPFYAKLSHLLPLDDIVEEIGRSDFYPGILDAGTFEGHVYGIAWECSGPMFWYRKDLFAERGLKVPRTWEELLECARVLTKEKEGFYGVVVPYGKNQWTAWYYETFMWSNGGSIFDKNFNIAFNSPQNAETLRYLKELSKYSPPGSSEYSFEQTMNSFITGKVAITQYYARILSETYKRNPSMADRIGAFMIKKKEYVQRIGYAGLGILKGSKNAKEAKKFLRYYLTNPDLVDVLHATPGQYMPVLKSMASSTRFNSHPLFLKHPDIFEVIKIATRGGKAIAFEHPGLANPYAYAIEATQIIEDTVQRVLLRGDSPEVALAWAQKEMEKVLEEAKKINR